MREAAKGEDSSKSSAAAEDEVKVEAAPTTTSPTPKPLALAASGSFSVADVEPPAVTAGRQVTVRGSGFASRAELKLRLGSPKASLGKGKANSSGRYNVRVVIPESTEVGDHRIDVVGKAADGGTHDSIGKVTVLAGPAQAPAAAEESDDGSTFPWWILAVIILVLAAVAFAAHRRRRPTAVTEA